MTLVVTARHDMLTVVNTAGRVAESYDLVLLAWKGRRRRGGVEGEAQQGRP